MMTFVCVLSCSALTSRRAATRGAVMSASVGREPTRPAGAHGCDQLLGQLRLRQYDRLDRTTELWYKSSRSRDIRHVTYAQLPADVAGSKARLLALFAGRCRQSFSHALPPASPRAELSGTGGRHDAITREWVPWWVPHPRRLTMTKRASRWTRALSGIAGEGLEPSTPAL